MKVAEVKQKDKSLTSAKHVKFKKYKRALDGVFMRRLFVVRVTTLRW